MRPIFCGNFDIETRQSELERLFRKYGNVDRVDMKSGFAFVYMEDERDGDDAVRRLDRLEFGRKGRKLRVEWAKEERGRRHESTRRSTSGTRMSKTLFVINFDPYHTRTRDLERHFEPYGKILNIRIRRNFAFIQFETQEDATKALDATHLSKVMDRVITVEYAINDDDMGDRGRDKIQRRDGNDRDRSRSPYRRERASPDYGGVHGSSPDYGRGHRSSPYHRERHSPDYGCRAGSSPANRRKEIESACDRSPNVRKRRYSGSGSASSLSPVLERAGPGNARGNGSDKIPSLRPMRRERSSISPIRPIRDMAGQDRSPNHRKDVERAHDHSPNHRGSDYEQAHDRSPNHRKRDVEQGRDLSPNHRRRDSERTRDRNPNHRGRDVECGGHDRGRSHRGRDYEQASDHSPNHIGRDVGQARDCSPRHRGRDVEQSHDLSPDISRKERAGPENGHAISPPERGGPEYTHRHSPSLQREIQEKSSHHDGSGALGLNPEINDPDFRRESQSPLST